MNKKKIILIMVVILVIIGIMITIREPEEYISRNITFGNQCIADEDCGDSFKSCEDGTDVSCENGCVYGRCTKCAPVCLKESRCGNVTCLDSVKVCPDGRTVRCANYCDIGGECTSCIPGCDIKVSSEINWGVKAGKFVVDAMPCFDADYTERTEKKVVKKDVTKIDLPKDYNVVMEPFSVEQDGPFNITLSVPETYTDVKVLRCRGEECNPVVTRYVTELRCGGKVSKEFLRKEEYLEPKFMPIKIEEISLNVISGDRIESDKYNVKLEGDFGSLDVSLAMPEERVEEAKNPGLKIIGTPLVIKIEGKVEGKVSAIVTMPYISVEGFEEDSIGMYIKSRKGWDYIGGEIDKEEMIVRATITDVIGYLNKENEIKVALMGILCVNCYGSSLTKVYQPENRSEGAIILIHGFNPELNTFQPLIDDVKLTNQPFDVWTFDYLYSRSIKENMEELMNLLENNYIGYENIYLVGHSLGGFILQQALYNSYLENERLLKDKKPFKYNYLNKVRKVILVAVPNEGSPVIEVYRNLFKNLINEDKGALFNPRSEVMEDMVKGIITPRVPGIVYNVIAGTGSYEFNLLFFGIKTEKLVDIYEKNDGIITVKSAQHIGDGYIDNQCEDYWELNLSHTELIDDPVAIKVIERIIAEDISIEGVLGHNRYFDLSVEDGSTEDVYIVTGKKIKEEFLLDETGCGCGNGYCGEGEDEVNCPSDCARFLSEEKKNWFSVWIIAILVVFIIFYQYARYRRFAHPHLKRLVNHIKTNYEIIPGEGYTHKQIKDVFLSKGWPKRIVEDLMKILKKEFYYTYHKPLKRHIKKYLKRGYTKEQVKRIFLDYGWKREVLDTVLKGEELEPGFRLKRRYKPKFEGERKFFGLKDRF